MKKGVSILLALFLALGFAGVASAHVTVQPGKVPAGSYQVFTLRVPSEKEAATTQVKVEVPADVDVSRFEPKPGWTYETEKDADGKIVSFTWKADGDGLGATEFGQFNFQGKVADNATSLSWKAYQTYSDGSVVEWTGAPDADTPASVTTVTAADASGEGAAAGSTDRDPLTLTLAIVGAAAGILALLVSLLRRRKA
ncbi:YcnI family protein [Cohnella zeiphila]|uniref:YcnI family protein n=1 Tax=Cohnella zeiphila TaxID=2761120 RepID=A0A7X0VV92_9BACL|nr:YcnI family protein [Cohnella zeiphila]MBB6731107.1 YcnI family protein [Cohnella zeiphila]